MIITKSTPYTKEQIKKLRELFDSYIKTVIDLETKVIDFNSFMNIRLNDAKTARRFSQETLKRRTEIKEESVKPDLRKFIKKLPEILSHKDKSKIAEYALMYSTIFQNYALKN